MDDVLCSSCRSFLPHFTALRSWSIYAGPVRRAVHEIKYMRNLALGELFAGQMASYFRTLGWSIDSVLPVPLGIARLAERGYNQAALLAQPLAWELGVSYRPGVIKRVRETHSQVDLDAKERRKNVSGAFQAASDAVRDRRFLLVDDVATTGSTLDACAVALLEGGAQAVYALTLARTPLATKTQTAISTNGGEYDS
jgi:competence protein ComFC